jgi:TPP-dependent pyruvate/acetoin dehydrogenase alpha subunit
MDPLAVFDAAGEAVARAREGKGPTFVECRTYRFVGHSRTDPGRYRPEGELEAWRERDPITLAAAALNARAGESGDKVAEITDAVEARIAESFESALAAPFPTASDPFPEYCDA